MALGPGCSAGAFDSSAALARPVLSLGKRHRLSVDAAENDHHLVHWRVSVRSRVRFGSGAACEGVCSKMDRFDEVRARTWTASPREMIRPLFQSRLRARISSAAVIARHWPHHHAFRAKAPARQTRVPAPLRQKHNPWSLRACGSARLAAAEARDLRQAPACDEPSSSRRERPSRSR